MHDAADHAPIIDTMGGFASARQQRLDPLPLRFAQPINLLCRPNLQITSENLNHKNARSFESYECSP
jgi:hypothetical protein